MQGWLTNGTSRESGSSNVPVPVVERQSASDAQGDAEHGRDGHGEQRGGAHLRRIRGSCRVTSPQPTIIERGVGGLLRRATRQEERRDEAERHQDRGDQEHLAERLAHEVQTGVVDRLPAVQRELELLQDRGQLGCGRRPRSGSPA